MDGDCLSPIAILCQDSGDEIKIIGKVLSYEGDKLIYKETKSSFKDIKKDIVLFADEFISEGAKIFDFEMIIINTRPKNLSSNLKNLSNDQGIKISNIHLSKISVY